VINRIQAVCIKHRLPEHRYKNRTLVSPPQPSPLLKSSAYLTAVLRISLPEQTKIHAKMTIPTTLMPYAV